MMVLALLASLAMSQAARPAAARPQAVTKVAVVDVSAPDAIYEDVSRALADKVVEALRATGVQSIRIDERDLPESGCRLGPCLGVAARAKNAEVVVMFDATEAKNDGATIELAALWSTNGAPVAVAKYAVVADQKKVPKPLMKFAVNVAKATRK